MPTHMQDRRPVMIQRETQKDKGRSLKTLWIIVGILSVLLIGGGSGYLVFTRLSEEDVLGQVDDPEYIEDIQQKQVEEILTELESILLINQEEEPTIATIMDVDELKTQNEEFYANAKEGDLLVIYSDRAIIFRRAENRVINVAPVFIETDEITE